MTAPAKIRVALLVLVLAGSSALGADTKGAAKERVAAAKLLKKGDKAGAAAAFKRATEADPADVGSFNDLAYVLLEMQDFEGCKKASEQALAIAGADDAKRAATLYNIGRAREGLRDPAMAREAYLSSLDLRFSRDAALRARTGAPPEHAARLVNALVSALGKTSNDEKGEAQREKILKALDEVVWADGALLGSLVQAPPSGALHGAGAKDLVYVTFDTHNGGTMKETQLHIVLCAADGCVHQAEDSSADYKSALALGQGSDRSLLFAGSDQEDNCHGEEFAELWAFAPAKRRFAKVEKAFPGGARASQEWSCDEGPARDKVGVRLIASEGAVCLTGPGGERKLKRAGGKFTEAGNKC